MAGDLDKVRTIVDRVRGLSDDSALDRLAKRKHRDDPTTRLTEGRKSWDDPAMPSTRQRWTTPTDFSVPAALADRPKSAAGEVTMHLDVQPIARRGYPTSAGKRTDMSGRPLGYQPDGTAEAHAEYIEREGAAERSAAHEDYITRHVVERVRDDAVEDEKRTLALASVSRRVTSSSCSRSTGTASRQFWSCTEALDNPETCPSFIWLH